MVMPRLDTSGLRDIGEGIREMWDTRTGWPALEKVIYGTGATQDGGQPMLSSLAPVVAQPSPLQAAPVGQVARTPIGASDPASKTVASAHSDTPVKNAQGWLKYSNQSATRSQPLNEKLTGAMSFLPELGVTMEVFSGGQPGAGQGPRVGSTRHDHGNAADVFFYKDGRKLDWANPQDRPLFAEIVKRARANGVTGFGAGDGYMQQGSMHIGFGNPAVWGAGGKGSNAPDWLRAAFNGSQGGGSPSQAQLESMAVGQSMPMGQGGQQMPPQQAMQGAGQPSGGSMLPDRETMRQLFQNRQTRPFAIQLAQNAMKARQGDPMAQIELEKARLELEQMRQPKRQNLINAGDGRLYDPNSDSWITAPDAGRPKAQPMTPEQRTQWGIPDTDTRPYMMTPEGPKVIGGTSGVTVNVGGESDADAELRKKLGGKEGEAWASYKEAGTVSAGTVQDMQLMDELIKMAPQGPIQGRLAQAFPGFSSAGAAFESIAKRVAPTLRAPGSGATSDIEYDGMLRSLPSLTNRPEANAAISEMMKAKSQINMARSDIITRYQNEEISVKDARRELAKLNSQSIISPQIERLFDDLGIDVRRPGSDGEEPLPGDIVDNHRFKGGDPSDMRNWEKLP